MRFVRESGRVVLALRRVAAAVIDIAIFFVAFWALAPVSYAITDGLVRQRDAVISSRTCIDVNPPPVTPPAWIRPTDARLCRTQVLGLTVDRAFVLDGVTPGSNTPASWSIAADSKGRPAPALYLDEVRFALMILAFAAFESVSGWTVGKHLVGVRLLDARSGRPLTFLRALERNGMIWGPLAIAELLTMVMTAISPLGAAAPPVAIAWYAAVGWLVIMTLLMLTTRTLPDRWAGVRAHG